MASIAAYKECPDSSLMEMALAGKTECFQILMDRHINAVRARVLSIVRNASDADDAMQEAMIKAWRGLSSFRHESSFRTWLIRIATNEAIMLIRREGRHRRCETPQHLEFLASTDESADQSLVRIEETRVLRRAVVNLPSKYRRVMILRHFKDLSTEETAQRLRATEGAVKSRLFRGRHMLLNALLLDTAA